MPLDSAIKELAENTAFSAELHHSYRKNGVCRCGIAETSMDSSEPCWLALKDVLLEFAQEVINIQGA